MDSLDQAKIITTAVVRGIAGEQRLAGTLRLQLTPSPLVLEMILTKSTKQPSKSFIPVAQKLGY